MKREWSMSRHLKMAVFILAGAACLSVGGGTASAIEINSPANNSALTAQQNADYLRALRNQIQRQQFQQQQQFDREQDRRSIPRPQSLDVPRMKPTCQTQVYGSNILKSCR